MSSAWPGTSRAQRTDTDTSSRRFFNSTHGRTCPRLPHILRLCESSLYNRSRPTVALHMFPSRQVAACALPSSHVYRHIHSAHQPDMIQKSLAASSFFVGNRVSAPAQVAPSQCVSEPFNRNTQLV